MATIVFNTSDIETIQPIVADQSISEERTIKNTPDEVRYTVPGASWMDAHPTLSNIIIGIMAVLAFYVVLFYNFTTH